MPWATPTLTQVRELVRDQIRGSLPGADAAIPNSVLRVMSDNQGALCHLVLQYIDWLSLQLLPDTAETEWLDRHGDIWLVNSDGSTGRKVATLAQGTATFTSIDGGIIVPAGTRLIHGNVEYETIQEFVVASGQVPTPGEIRALDPGVIGNLVPGDSLAISTTVAGVDGTAVAIDVDGGVDEESDDDLRIRVLERIRQPPQGGAAHDYVRWAKAVPGVTRAWCEPLEMGIGTVTVRFMMDELRADNDGFPFESDCETVAEYIDTQRPVAVKDFFVVAPLKQRIDILINNLNPSTDAVKAEIKNSIEQMLFDKAKPGQTIYAAWKYCAIMESPNVVSFSFPTSADDVMPSPGHMAVLGDIVYGT